jgi:hypothetical protein
LFADLLAMLASWLHIDDRASRLSWGQGSGSRV